LRTHDDKAKGDVFKGDVFFNLEKFPELQIEPGNLIQVIAIDADSAPVDAERKKDHPSLKSTIPAPGNSPYDRQLLTNSIATYDENGHLLQHSPTGDMARSYFFLAEALSPEERQRQQGVALSISSAIAAIFGFRRLAHVIVRVVSRIVPSEKII